MSITVDERAGLTAGGRPMYRSGILFEKLAQIDPYRQVPKLSRVCTQVTGGTSRNMPKLSHTCMYMSMYSMLYAR